MRTPPPCLIDINRMSPYNFFAILIKIYFPSSFFRMIFLYRYYDLYFHSFHYVHVHLV